MGKGGREMGEGGRDGGRWEVVPSSTDGIGVCITLGNVGAEATDVITVYFLKTLESVRSVKGQPEYCIKWGGERRGRMPRVSVRGNA